MTNSIVLLDWENIMEQTYPMILEGFANIYLSHQEFYNGLVVTFITGTFIAKLKKASIDIIFGKILFLPKRVLRIIKNLLDLYDSIKSLDSQFHR